MKISCVKKEGKQNVITIYIDEEPWREIHIRIFGGQPRLPVDCASVEELRAIIDEAEYSGAKRYALRRLAAKSQPINELRQKLAEHFVSEESIQRIVEDCQRLGYLNDQNWIESFVQHCIRRRVGPQVILMKLQAKGFSKEEAVEALGKICGAGAQREQIAHLLQTRYRKHDLTDFHARHKVVQALLRKGFTMPEIQRQLKVEG